MSLSEKISTLLVGIVLTILAGYLLNRSLGLVDKKPDHVGDLITLEFEEKDTNNKENPDKIVKVNQTYHIWCKGKKQEGKPVVLFEPNSAGFHQSFAKLFEKVSDTRIACTYDRMGKGFSSHNNSIGANRVLHKTIDPIKAVNHLKLLLEKKFKDEKLIIVSHGYGNLLSASYALTNPKQVEALYQLSTPTDDSDQVGSVKIKLGLFTSLSGILRVLSLLGIDVPNFLTNSLSYFKSENQDKKIVYHILNKQSTWDQSVIESNSIDFWFDYLKNKDKAKEVKTNIQLFSVEKTSNRYEEVLKPLTQNFKESVVSSVGEFEEQVLKSLK